MFAGGVGFANDNDALKDIPEEGDIIVVLVATITGLEWVVVQYHR